MRPRRGLHLLLLSLCMRVKLQTSLKSRPKERTRKVCSIVIHAYISESGEKSSGWFGWLKRGSAEPAAGAPVPGKPIKAKLGEESSFYYDKDLKKWVNKKVFSLLVKLTISGGKCSYSSSATSAPSQGDRYISPKHTVGRTSQGTSHPTDTKCPQGSHSPNSTVNIYFCSTILQFAATSIATLTTFINCPADIKKCRPT